MQLYITIAVICLGKIALAEERMVTHMPFVPDQHLDQDTQAALKSAQTDSICFESVNQEINMWAKRKSMFGNRNGPKTDPISPCDACAFDMLQTAHIRSKEDAKIATYVKGKTDPSVADVFMEFKSLEMFCRGCHMVDNSGSKVTGDINAVWTNGRAQVIIKLENDCENSKVLFINATNVNTHTVKVECKGDKAFKKTCMETHKARELDHMIQNGIEIYFEKGYVQSLFKGTRFETMDIIHEIFEGCCQYSYQ